MNDPYEELGVARNADAKTIKRVYRRRVMKEHPDRGGNEEGFKRLQLAYDVLGDPARREKYDRFGESGVDQQAQKALAEIAAMFVQLVEQVDSDHTDIRAIIIQRIEDGIAQRGQAISRNRQSIAKLERAAKRVRKKSGGENMVSGFFQAHILVCQRAIATSEHEIERGKMMLKIVEDYEYVVDGQEAFNRPGMYLRFSTPQNPNNWNPNV